MEFSLKVDVNLGEKTLAFLSGIFSGAATIAPRVIEPKSTDTAKDAPKPEAPAAPAAPAKTQRPAAPKPTAPEKPTFSELDDDAKLEAIKAEVTKHTKKGKSADIKFLLANYEAGRASELAPEQYDAFFESITRYGAGEAVTDLFPALD